MIHACLVHLSYNMWLDWDNPEYAQHSEVKRRYYAYKPYLRFDDVLWDEMVNKMAEGGVNTVLLDLGDGVRYESHPEIAVDGAWSVARLRDELAKLRDRGIEPIPKLNFSTWHDAWLGEYQRMVSTETYYTVCRDLIAEVCELFDTPSLFHLGWDEEFACIEDGGDMARAYRHRFSREPSMFWHDFYFFIGQVEKHSSRPWVFFDERNPGGPEAIYRKTPKSVVLTAWHYGRREAFDSSKYKIKAFHELSEFGFDQIPCGSNFSCLENYGELVDYCQEHVRAEHLLGFLMTTWQPTIEACRERILEALDEVATAAAQTKTGRL